MLTGMTSVTSGKASIFGYDVRDENDMTMIRRMTGICPQHDVLFDELTPTEHLQFFARIRGMDEREVPGEVEDILNDIDLADKKDDVVKNLSGGQKRKLSVGVALIGDPKIIFLGSVQQPYLSSQFAFQCRNLPQLLSTQKDVAYLLNLPINLQFWVVWWFEVFNMCFKRGMTFFLI